MATKHSSYKNMSILHSESNYAVFMTTQTRKHNA